MSASSQSDPTWKQSDAVIGRIMQRHRVSCSPAEFHHAVNVTFHEFESEIYDQGHQDMWNSLPQQFELLVNDCLRQWPDVPGEIHLLDIGCGTGLATDSVLRTAIGKRIKTITLLDTSPAMLRRAAQRAASWPAPISSHEGLLDSLPAGSQFHLIITSSVLHHVPDLQAFAQAVRRVQAPGGVFLHIQDPNGDYLNDPDLQRRMAENSRTVLPEWLSRLSPSRIARRLYRELIGQKGEAYIWKTNQALMQKGVISEPLTVPEIFAITDIHTDLGDGEGVSLSRMRSWMPDYQCVAQRSYAFFGALWSTLPPQRKKIEEQLIADGALNGFHIGAAWRLRQ